MRPADLGGVLRLHIARAARPVAALQCVVDAVLPFLEEGKGKADNGVLRNARVRHATCFESVADV